MRYYCVYILTNRKRGILYTGLSGNLPKRMDQHRDGILPGFAARYRLNKLVYVEVFDNPYNAIAREKQIKGWLRRKKITLVESVNPDWKDLGDDTETGIRDRWA